MSADPDDAFPNLPQIKADAAAPQLSDHHGETPGSSHHALADYLPGAFAVAFPLWPKSSPGLATTITDVNGQQHVIEYDDLAAITPLKKPGHFHLTRHSGTIITCTGAALLTAAAVIGASRRHRSHQRSK